MGKKSGSRTGSGMNNPASYFRELRNNFELKYLISLVRIRYGKNSDPGWKKFESGMGKIWIRDINIPDPQH
jgi:hypothetical protein